MTGTRTVLDAARANGVSRFVFISSPSVAHSGSALAGAGADPADPRRAKGHYSRSKARAELDVLAADAPGFATIAIRPHLIWGPGDTQLVGRIVDRARSGRLALVGGGRALIDTTYIDNAVDAVVAALDHAEAGHGQAFVVSNGEPRTVAELVERICAAYGVEAPTRSVPRSVAWSGGAVAEGLWWLGRRTDDPPMTRFLAGQLATAHWFDQRRVREVLEWSPRVSLDEGFARLADHGVGTVRRCRAVAASRGNRHAYPSRYDGYAGTQPVARSRAFDNRLPVARARSVAGGAGAPRRCARWAATSPSSAGSSSVPT